MLTTASFVSLLACATVAFSSISTTPVQAKMPDEAAFPPLRPAHFGDVGTPQVKLKVTYGKSSRRRH